jgi:hypothetical protein
VKSKEILKNTAIGFAICGLLFILVEGLCSSALVVNQILRHPAVIAERFHTCYDQELGWVGLPNVYILAMYGPANYVIEALHSVCGTGV